MAEPKPENFQHEQYMAICEEHDVPLNPDGSCPQCRDANGKPFVLDMQSYYLVRPGWWAVLQKRRAEAKV